MKQIYGMLLIVAMAILVSLSTLGEEKDPTKAVFVHEDDRVPVWLAILVSFTMPCICTLFIVVIKHVNDTLRIASYDFTIAYWMVASAAYLIVGAIDWKSHHGETFSWSLWFDGTFGSLFNLLGCVFAISCFSVPGCSIGPATAVINTQTILVVILSSIIDKSVPNLMQIIGLILGLTGAMILTLPKELYAMWYRLTRC